MDISVIVPIYNSEQYLRRCLQSLTNQKGVNYEFICVNDGSTDNSLSICNEFISKDNRFKILNIEHHGVSRARNTGLSIAKGKYICFLDSDDSMAKYALLKLFKMAEKNMCDTLIYSAKVKNGASWMYNSFPKHNKLIEKFETKDIFRLKECRPFVWTHFVRRSVITGLSFNEALSLGEDQEFIIHYLSRVNRVFFTKNKLYIHYNHTKSNFNIISSNPGRVCRFHIILVTLVISEIELNTPEFAEWIFDTLYTPFIKSNKDINDKRAIQNIFMSASVEKYLSDEKKIRLLRQFMGQ